MPPWSLTGLWRHANFRRLWAARGVNAVGSRVTRTALPVIAILLIKAPPADVAILSALGLAPGVLMGLLAGGRIERAAKLPVLIWADLVRAALVMTVPLAAWLHGLSMIQLYVVAAAVGVATTVSRIADGSFLPILVAPDQLIDANAKLEASDSVAEAAGPGLAGALIQAFGAPFSMLLDGLSYVGSALLLGRISTAGAPRAVDGPATSMIGDAWAGLSMTLRHPVVRRLLIAEGLSSLFGGAFSALYMVLGLSVLKLTPAVLGLVISVGGVGAFAGAAVAGRLARAVGVGPAMILCFCVGEAGGLFVPLSVHAGAWALPALIAQQLLGDAFLVAFAIHAVSLRQREIPLAFLARVTATFYFVAGLCLPLGTLAAAALVGLIGVAPTLWIGAIGGLASTGLLFSASVWSER